MSKELSVRQVAESTGLSVHTLRYYERAGLMAPVGRAPNGHRRYTEDNLDWIALLRCLRSTGMPIAEMRRFAHLAKRGETTLPERRELLEAHKQMLKDQITQIHKTLAVLDAKLTHTRTAEAAQSPSAEVTAPYAQE